MHCSAHKGSTGEPCGAYAIKGGTVCAGHGGKAPQVKAKAQVRLDEAREAYLELLMPGLARLEDIVRDGRLDSPVLMRALELISDRTLGKVTDKLKLSGDSDEPLEIIVTRRSSGDVPMAESSGTSAD